MKNYLYYDKASGEEFIVEALNKEEAQRTAEMYFEEPKLDSQISDFEAEMLGLDTYQGVLNMKVDIYYIAKKTVDVDDRFNEVLLLDDQYPDDNDEIDLLDDFENTCWRSLGNDEDLYKVIDTDTNTIMYINEEYFD